MKRKTHIIMPMAGEGNRFKDAGYTMPKPLIEYNGKPLFVNAMDSVKNIKYDSITFVVREEHLKEHQIDQVIHQYYPDAIIMVIQETTRGAADTVFLAVRNLILSHVAEYTDSIIIMDCDVVVQSEQWEKAINKPTMDGILLSFNSNDDRYSYAAVVNNKVLRTAEKEPISEHAITSPYFIKKIEYFVDSFHDMERFHKPDGSMTYKEMYVSLLYNFLIANKHNIKLIPVDSIISLGTPEELERNKT